MRSRLTPVLRESFARPYPVTLPMVALMLVVPGYIFIAHRVAVGPLSIPELPWDRLVPLRPAWSLVYGALYLFLIVLPVFLVRQEEHIRRTFVAYLFVWLVAYAIFLTYPTAAPRPSRVIGGDFGAWGLRALYGADPPYNCFPSLHVAHSFISAFTCHRVHRRVGNVAILCAGLVAVSTLYTRQHYIADVVAGMLLAVAAYAVFLRGYDRNNVPVLDRQAASVLSLALGAFVALVIAGAWVVYKLGFAQ